MATDTPDWVAPVQFREVDMDLVVGGGERTLNSRGTDVYDTSTLTSVQLNFLSRDNANGERLALQITWFNASNVVAVDSLSFHASGSYNMSPAAALQWDLPVKATSMSVNIVGPTGCTVAYHCVGSNRTVQRPYLGDANSGPNNCIGTYTGGTVLAGATSPTFYIPPVDRAIAIRTTIIPASVSLIMRGLSLEVGLVQLRDLALIAGSGVAPNLFEIPCVRSGLELSWVNNSSSNYAPVTSVWDVS